MKFSPGYLFLLFNPFSKIPWSHRSDMWGRFRLASNPPTYWNNENNSNFNYVTMGGANHIDLIVESLRSITLSWKSRPKLSIISDGTFKEHEHLNALKFWGHPIEIVTPEKIFAGLPKNLAIPLRKLSKDQPLMLKLAAIIYLSSKGSFFFADSDLLWFTDPLTGGLIDPQLKGIQSTQEFGCSLDENLASHFCPPLITENSVNSGCVWVGTDLAKIELLSKLLEFIEQSPKNAFSEQTIIGILASRDGGFFSEKLCFLKFDDIGKIKHNRPWKVGYASRHYVRPVRHHFFRDAYHLASKSKCRSWQSRSQILNGTES